MTVTTEELNKLSKERQLLIKSFDKKEVSEVDYEKRLAELDSDINKEIVRVLEAKQAELKKREEDRKQLEEKQMAEEKVEKEKKVLAKPKGPREDSLASLVAKALMMKSVKKQDDAVAKLIEWKPGLDPKKAAARVKVIIGCIKKGKPARWTAYTWNEAEYQLTLKE